MVFRNLETDPVNPITCADCDDADSCPDFQPLPPPRSKRVQELIDRLDTQHAEYKARGQDSIEEPVEGA